MGAAKSLCKFLHQEWESSDLHNEGGEITTFCSSRSTHLIHHTLKWPSWRWCFSLRLHTHSQSGNICTSLRLIYRQIDFSFFHIALLLGRATLQLTSFFVLLLFVSLFSTAAREVRVRVLTALESTIYSHALVFIVHIGEHERKMSKWVEYKPKKPLIVLVSHNIMTS